MKKLKLDPESLRVESFDVRGRRDAAKGTVAAHSFFTAAPNQACSEPKSAECMYTDYGSCVDMCHMTGTDPSCID